MQLESLPADLQQLVDTISQTPLGEEETAMVRKALALAEQYDLPVWAYKLRMWLNQSVFVTGDTDALLSSFTKTLAIHDSNPEKFPLVTDDGTQLLFQYKWVAEELNNSPAYSLAQIHAIYADMERRFRESGASPAGYLQVRFSSATERGEWDDAARFYGELQSAPRDDLSHCEACFRSAAAMYHNEIGEPERALELYEEIFSGRFTCGDEPEHSEARAMYLYLRRGDETRGDLEHAKALHHKSLAALRRNPDPGSMLLTHIDFCVLTGNVARALELAEGRMKSFETPLLNVAFQFRALTILARLADALVAEGEGERLIRGTSAPYISRLLDVIESRERTAVEIAPLAWARAKRIAAQFDERNGNSYYESMLERAQDAERIDVQLGFEQFEAPEPEPESAVPAAEPNSVLEHVAAVRNAVRVDYSAAVDLYRRGLALASAAADSGTPDPDAVELVLALLNVPSELVPAGAPAFDMLLDDLARVGSPRLAGVIGGFGPRFLEGLSADDRPQILEQAQEISEAEPSGAAVLLLEGANLLALPGQEDAARALELTQIAQKFAAGTVTRQRIALASASFALDTGELSAVARALKIAEENSFGAYLLDANLAFLTGTLAYLEHHPEQGVAAMEEAVALALKAGNKEAAWRYLVRKANVQGNVGSRPDAIRTIRRALRLLAQTPEREEHEKGLNLLLGRFLLDAGDPNGALEPLTQVLDAHFSNGPDQVEDPEGLLEVLRYVGEAAFAAGDYQQAYSAWNYALTVASEAERTSDEFGVALRLSGFLVQMEDEDAVGLADRALELARGMNDPVALAEAAKSRAVAGVVCAQSEDVSVLEEAESALRDEDTAVDPQIRVVALLELEMHRARLLWRMDSNDEAAASALRAAGSARELGIAAALGDALTIAGLANRDAGNLPGALVSLREAHELALAAGETDAFLAERIAEIEAAL